MRFLHTMVRVTDIDKSLDFYCNKLGFAGGPRKEVPAGATPWCFWPPPARSAAARSS